MRMYEAEKLSANLEIGDDLQASYEGFIIQIDQKTKQNKTINLELEELNDDIAKNTKEQNDGLLSIVAGKDAIDISSFSVDRQEKLRELLEEKGLSWSIAYGTETAGGKSTFVVPGLQQILEDNPKYEEYLEDEMTKFVGGEIYQKGKDLNAKRLEKERAKTANELFI